MFFSVVYIPLYIIHSLWCCMRLQLTQCPNRAQNMLIIGSANLPVQGSANSDLPVSIMKKAYLWWTASWNPYSVFLENWIVWLDSKDMKWSPLSWQRYVSNVTPNFLIQTKLIFFLTDFSTKRHTQVCSMPNSYLRGSALNFGSETDYSEVYVVFLNTLQQISR
jgi:hypothetical protein